MTQLNDQKHVPDRAEEPSLPDLQTAKLLAQLPQWQIVERHGINRLERTYTFVNFVEALDFANRVGELAEAEDHHPAILVQWGKASVSWWTHSVKGLHQNDFAMAAKTEELF